ncbi:MAG TPA: nucleotide sugar dehydrogenase [Methylomirabilota bacterium]|jgi:UDP-N-acetyl-D-glucosamine dehydrogenase|nr:nucleotide sugar dehydrogenase [Methylomirabilota bacterium]
MNPLATELRQRIEARSATVGIIGLGYVGLPLAVTFAEAGFPVSGVDADAGRVERLQRGSSPVEDVRDSTLAALVDSKRLVVKGSTDALGEADAIVICVPTPLSKSKEPDISHIVTATDQVARILRPGQLVVLESTTYPGTTEEILLPRFAGPGMAVGEQFFLAFSPERVDPGNRAYGLPRIPKVVGGVTAACRELAGALYAQIIERVVPVSSTQAAEMVKLFENSFRSVNIALVNELAIMCRRLGLSVWEVIQAASTKPFGFMPFYPGPGIGGHCLPSDPYYLSWKARLAGYEAKFIAFADEINGAMPSYVLQLATDALNERGKPVKGSRILALGVAYKAGVGDVRESPALAIIDALLLRGAEVDYTDPHVPEIGLGRRRMPSLAWERADLGSYDLVLVLTAHPEFDARRVVGEARLVLDARNLTGALCPQPHVIRL